MTNTSSPEPPLLEIEDLEVRYGRIPAVRNLTLRIPRGEATVIIGPNGAGKTTTMMAIAGALRPSRGHILFDGTSAGGLRPEALVKLGVALVPEGRRIFGRLSVAENLALGSTLVKDKAQRARDVAETLEVFPVLAQYYRSSADRLSGGEQQQLAIARALVGHPKLMLLDEPSLGLAPLMIDRVYEVLTALRARGTTLLVVEQSAVRARGFADNLHVMSNGTLSGPVNAGEIESEEALVEAYFGGAGSTADDAPKGRGNHD